MSSDDILLLMNGDNHLKFNLRSGCFEVNAQVISPREIRLLAQQGFIQRAGNGHEYKLSKLGEQRANQLASR